MRLGRTSGQNLPRVSVSICITGLQRELSLNLTYLALELSPIDRPHVLLIRGIETLVVTCTALTSTFIQTAFVLRSSHWLSSSGAIYAQGQTCARSTPAGGESCQACYAGAVLRLKRWVTQYAGRRQQHLHMGRIPNMSSLAPHASCLV